MNQLIKIALKVFNNQKRLSKKNEEILLLEKESLGFFKKDLFFIFTILGALIKNNKENINGFDLGKILKLLAKNAVKPGGPYYNNKKIDLKTNLAIAYFLKLYEVDLNNLTTYLADKKVKLVEFKIVNQKDVKDKNEAELLKLMIKLAEKRLSAFNSQFKKDALEEINKTLTRNKDKQMSLISYYLYQSIGKNLSAKSKIFLSELGLMNIFFWSAFIIYDNFWDEDEEAETNKLPVANLFTRDYLNFYYLIFKNQPEFILFFKKIMDKLDEANNWETNYCRLKVRNNQIIIPEKIIDYKNYEKKFYPAAGQIIGPIAVLNQEGYKINSPEIKLLIDYFKNYLIAMQINDDAHDWEEDLNRGHLSTVTVILIKDWLKINPTKKLIDLQKDLPTLKEIFWKKTIKKAANITLKHTKKSRFFLKKMIFLKEFKYLEHFINISENIAYQALRERKRGIDLLKELKTPF